MSEPAPTDLPGPDLAGPATAARVEARLRAALAPERLSVTDESHLHAGHGGWREGGGTHFRVEVVSAAFAGRGRVARHRMVNKALAAELAAGVHALAVRALAPGEPGA